MESKKKALPFEAAKEQKQMNVSRRCFLKKTAYSAPVLIIMGQLARPVKIHADQTGGPPPPPGWYP